MRDFFAMGGYGAYVWGAYGAALLILAGLAWASLRQLRRAQARLASVEPPARRARP